MRGIGTLHPTDMNPIPADTVLATALTGGTAQAFDYPSRTEIVRLNGATTAGAAFSFAFNDGSTSALWASAAATATTGSSGRNPIVGAGGMIYQIPGGSTGFSLISGSSGIVSVEFWRKGASS